MYIQFITVWQDMNNNNKKKSTLLSCVFPQGGAWREDIRHTVILEHL